MTTPTLDRPLSQEAVQRSAGRTGDRVFRGMTLASGILILVIMAAIAAFLLWQAVPSLRANTANFFTTSQWFPDQSPPAFGIAALTFGTIVTALIAMVLAVPVGVGIALFITVYAHARIASMLGFITDLLAAVPSIIFGLWGLGVLMTHLQGLMQWLNDYLGFIPIFKNTQDLYTRSIMIASIVLAIMILPTVSSLTREVFRQVPHANIEAAWALGATRWEMVRLAILPYGRSGMISAAMLGLGRALGETIAVALVLSASFTINWHLTEPGGNTFAANIALQFNEAGPIGLSALIASGLVLFVITLLVNMAARLIVRKHTELGGAA